MAMRNAVWGALVLACLAVLASLPGSALAQTKDWANKLFEVHDHDFGDVAKGAQLKFAFKITNIYKVPLQISDIRVTCGCLTWTPIAKPIEPNESVYLHTNMDASKFSGHKEIKMYVTVGPQYVSTATLRLVAHARTDVVFNPGFFDFGVVGRGQGASKSIDADYAGYTKDWQITEVVKNAGAPFAIEVKETRRQASPRYAGAFDVGYRMSITLKPDAPAGPFKEEIILKTSDNRVMTVSAEGNVQASLQVSPSAVSLGAIKVGETKTHRVLVRGSRPFRITAIDGLGAGLEADLPAAASTTHLVTIRCQPDRAGEVHRQLTFRTDMDAESAIIVVDAKIVP